MIQDQSELNRLNRARLSAIVKNALSDLDEKDNQKISDSYNNLFDALIKYHAELGEKILDRKEYALNEPRNPSKYNQNIIGLSSDLDVIFAETEAIRIGYQHAWNYSSIATTGFDYELRDIEEVLDSIEEKVKFENALVTKTTTERVIVISDSFNDLRRTDLSRTTCHVDTDYGIVTLERTESRNRGLSTQRIHVTVHGQHGAGVDKSRSDTSSIHEDKLPKFPRVYEGLRFATIGGARPEGGRFWIQQYDKNADTADASIVDGVRYVSRSGQKVQADSTGQKLISISGQEFTKNPEADDPALSLTPNEFLGIEEDGQETLSGSSVQYGAGKDANKIRRTDAVFVETELDDSDLEEFRYKMIDGDSQTFWEIEWTPALFSSSELLPNQSDDLASRFSQLEKLARAKMKELSGSNNLEITIQFDLDASYTMNFLTLFPKNFTSDSSAPMEVVEIVLSDDPEFSNPTNVDVGSRNVLTRDVNSSLDSSTQKLSRSTSVNPGAGIWAFEPVSAKYVRFRIRQSNPLPAPYEQKRIQTYQKINYSLSEQAGSSKQTSDGFGDGSNVSKNLSLSTLEQTEMTNMFTMGYLETILSEDRNLSKALAGASDPDTFQRSDNYQETGSKQDGNKEAAITGIITTAGGAALTAASSTIPTTAAAIAGVSVALAAGGALLAAKFSSSESYDASFSKSEGVNDSGVNINWESMKPNFSRARYAMAIREITMNSNSYTVQSSYFSAPEKIFGGVKSISISVDMAFMNVSIFDVTREWLQFWIHINDRAYPIQPLNLPSTSSEPLKTIIEPEITGDANVSIQVNMMRPSESRVLNASSHTPVLKKYSLRIVQ